MLITLKKELPCGIALQANIIKHTQFNFIWPDSDILENPVYCDAGVHRQATP